MKYTDEDLEGLLKFCIWNKSKLDAIENLCFDAIPKLLYKNQNNPEEKSTLNEIELFVREKFNQIESQAYEKYLTQIESKHSPDLAAKLLGEFFPESFLPEKES